MNRTRSTVTVCHRLSSPHRSGRAKSLKESGDPVSHRAGVEDENSACEGLWDTRYQSRKRSNVRRLIPTKRATRSLLPPVDLRIFGSRRRTLNVLQHERLLIVTASLRTIAPASDTCSLREHYTKRKPSPSGALQPISMRARFGREKLMGLFVPGIQ